MSELRPSRGIPGDAIELTSAGLLGPAGVSVYPPSTVDPVELNLEQLRDLRAGLPAAPPRPTDFQGWAVPVGVGLNGRSRVTTGDDQLMKLLTLAFSPCDSANPFQTLGLTRAHLFDLNDPTTWGILRVELVQIAAAFSDRILVRMEDISLEANIDEAYIEASITYTDLDTGLQQSVDVPIYPSAMAA